MEQVAWIDAKSYYGAYSSATYREKVERHYKRARDLYRHRGRR
jgi:hypothetical protein